MYIPGRKSQKEREKKEDDRRRGSRETHATKAKPGDIDLLKLQRAYEDLEEAHRQLRESHVEMIYKLAIAAEYKDSDTGNHILRISDYSTALAEALKLSDDEVANIRYASPMHDIGKIGIPDRILQKPGKLDAQEWTIMKTHTVIGARMFQGSSSPLLAVASEIALTHHEKFDGSGYPNGQKGEEIPLAGRIVALVDVFDAITTKRCYKDKWPYEEGIAYIKTLSGTHMDPKLVELFAKNEKRIYEIYNANLKIQEFLDESNAEANSL